jgi:hypothetical protein
MRIDRDEPRDTTQAETRTETVDEIGEILIVGWRLAPIRLILVLAFHCNGGQTHDIEAIAGIERIVLRLGGRGFELFVKQPGNRLRHPQRPARAGNNMLHHPIDAKQARFEAPRAFAVADQDFRQILRQRQQRRLDRFAHDDRLGKAPLGEIGRRFERRRDRVFGPADETVEPGEEQFAETRMKRRARPKQNVVDAAQARLREFAQRLRIKTQSCHWQRTETAPELFFIAVRENVLVAEMRQRPGGFRCRCDGGARRKILGGKTRFDVAGKLGFAAEEMRRAGNVEQKSVRRVARDERREAPAPVGNIIEQLRFGLGIGRMHEKVWRDGAGIREHHAGHKAASLGHNVDSDELLRALDLGNGGERPLMRAGAGASQPDDPIRR